MKEEITLYGICKAGKQFNIRDIKFLDNEIALFCYHKTCKQRGSVGCPCLGDIETPAVVMQVKYNKKDIDEKWLKRG